MSDTLTTAAPSVPLPEAAPAFTAALRRAFLDRLGGIHGSIAFHEDGVGTRLVGIAQPGEGAFAVRIHSPEFYRYACVGGSVGLGEAYMLGLWSADDIVGVVRLLIRNAAQLEALDSGLARLTLPLLKLYDWSRRNTRRGSRLNIAAHYDLGNALFEQFLDPGMTYSSGIYATGAETLEQAQFAKLDAVCRKLELQPGQHVVEIGSGWGSFALHAASRYGVRVTTTTISQEQHRLATERVREAGLADRVTILRSDYRDLRGRYDRLVSLEMIEAVGHENYPAYLSTCERLLQPDGQALIQAITCADQRYAYYRRTSDFIRRYIFPGGHLPSVTELLRVATRHTQLRLFDLADYSGDYALTLAEWRRRFHARHAQVRALGYDEAFVRMWDFYLAICEAGFAERYNGVVQLLLTMPGARRATAVR